MNQEKSVLDTRTDEAFWAKFYTQICQEKQEGAAGKPLNDAQRSSVIAERQAAEQEEKGVSLDDSVAS